MRRGDIVTAVRPVAVVQGALALLSMGCSSPSSCAVTCRCCGGREQPFGQADVVQVRRRLGKSRGLDAPVGDDPRHCRTRRWRSSNGASERDARSPRSARRRLIALGFYAFLLFSSNPFARIDPGAGGWQRIEPAAAGPRFGVPPADALCRLCRHLDRLLLRGRGAGDARRRAGLCARDAALGARRLDFPDARHHRG